MAVWLLLLRWKKIEWRSKGLFWVNSLSGPISWRNSDSGAAAAFALQTFWVYTTLKIWQSSIYVMIRLIHKKSNQSSSSFTAVLVRIFMNKSLGWVAELMGQSSYWASVWCSKYYFFFLISCKILCKNCFNLFSYSSMILLR